MQNLGTIKRINDLRSIWPHEAYDFITWLAKEENLRELSKEIAIDIVLTETESSVGSFSIDICTSEEGTARKIIIENQLEDTNHDHLGKIITYAAGKGAEITIWIVKHARDEHRQAIKWLNQHTDENIGFFLIEIELWSIGDSLPAPKFNIVERPNDWTKYVKASEGLSSTRKLQLDFWHAFNDYAFVQPSIVQHFKKCKPQARQWYSLGIGTSLCSLALAVNTQKRYINAAICIGNDKDCSERFKSNLSQIEHELSCKVEWIEASKSSRIQISHKGDIEKHETWPTLFDWFCTVLPKLKAIAKKYAIE